MKALYNKKHFNCKIKVFSVDNIIYVELQAKQKLGNIVNERFNFSKHCSDENKQFIIDNIKKWYLLNATDLYSDPDQFINIIYCDLKKVFRMHDWKSLSQLIKDRDNIKNASLLKLYNEVIGEMEILAHIYPTIKYSYGLFMFINKNNEIEYIEFKK